MAMNNVYRMMILVLPISYITLMYHLMHDYTHVNGQYMIPMQIFEYIRIKKIIILSTI